MGWQVKLQMSFPGFLFCNFLPWTPLPEIFAAPGKPAACKKNKEAERYQQLLQDPEVQPLVKQILKYKKCLKLPMWVDGTVDGRNPAPPGMYKTL